MSRIFICVVIGICFNLPMFAKMEIHKQLTSKFKKEYVPTEASAYRALKEKPVKCKCTYVAIPWVVLINKEKLHEIKLEKVKNGFTICQHIHFRRIIPILKKMGVKVLFTPHAEEKELNGIKIIPFPHVAKQGCLPAKEKDLLYSFIGRQTHPCRKAIYQLPPSSDAIVEEIKGHTGAPVFQQVLARSRFSLCPRGTGPSSIRFWESLQAGAIPVVIADAMTFPPNFDWESCIIKIPENEVASIPDVIRKIDPSREKAMREACYKAYNLFSNANITSVIHDYFNKAR